MRVGPTAHTRTEMPVSHSIRTEPSASMPLSGFLTAFPIYDAYNVDSFIKREKAVFLGVDKDAESRERARWLERRKRMCTRK
ncbi:hypothetical protein J6590_042712 [Homalodisca vitripennis]|nr:hypothetical protein J6590_042712 [Homalodisca vitripennis]